jgi:hypothetical protein
VAPRSNAVSVGTLVDVELFKSFRPTGYQNTCEGIATLAPLRAGSTFFFGVPSFSAQPLANSTASAQLQSSALTSQNTCQLEFAGTAPSPPGVVNKSGDKMFASFQVRDPDGTASASYFGEITVEPVSRPDLPSVAQRVHIEMLSQA